jgi:hypothetical protein
MDNPESHYCEVELQVSGSDGDTLNFKMPNWMPGYYQLMDYFKGVENVTAKDEHGKKLTLQKVNKNSWKVGGVKGKSLSINYSVKTARKFVATSYVDAAHAYLVTAGLFMYPDGFLNTPVTVKVSKGKWTKVATFINRRLIDKLHLRIQQYKHLRLPQQTQPVAHIRSQTEAGLRHFACASRNSSTFAGCTSAFGTFFQCLETVPSGPMMTVERVVPVVFLPYCIFSPNAPYSRITLVSGLESSTNGSLNFLTKLTCDVGLSLLIPSTTALSFLNFG